MIIPQCVTTPDLIILSQEGSSVLHFWIVIRESQCRSIRHERAL